jgi:hypothetical protein
MDKKQLTEAAAAIAVAIAALNDALRMDASVKTILDAQAKLLTTQRDIFSALEA